VLHLSCSCTEVPSCAAQVLPPQVLWRGRACSGLACSCLPHTQHYQALCSALYMKLLLHQSPDPTLPLCDRLSWCVLLLPSCCRLALCCQVDGDIIVEYVAAPAPDIEELIQQVLPSSSAADGTAADQDAARDGEGDGDDDADRGYGGLGLGAAPGLGSTAGLGSSGALGLGFTKASEPSSSATAVDPEVGRGGARGGCSGAVPLVAVVACMQISSSNVPACECALWWVCSCVCVCVWVGSGPRRATSSMMAVHRGMLGWRCTSCMLHAWHRMLGRDKQHGSVVTNSTDLPVARPNAAGL